MSNTQFLILLEPDAMDDIQSAIDFYDQKQVGLGKQFEKELNDYFSSLEKAPYFTIRYDDVHCLPLKKFPFMIHYTIDNNEKILIIRAVFHTSLNPKKWKGAR
jgi:toxin ParE1/3/4